LHFFKVNEDTACHSVVSLVVVFGCGKDLMSLYNE
jgi:hypothetical protein